MKYLGLPLCILNTICRVALNKIFMGYLYKRGDGGTDGMILEFIYSYFIDIDLDKFKEVQQVP